jgi:hypothetical protein
MKIFHIILLGLSPQLTSYAQTFEKDFVISSWYNNEFMSKCFEGLSQSPKLDSLQERVGFRFCSIAACVNDFTTRYVHEQERELIKLRLEELSERFIKEGTPIILFLGGHRSSEYVNKLNSEKNEFNIRYVSSGNYCQRSETEGYFEFVFNQHTKKLLGLDKKKNKQGR